MSNTPQSRYRQGTWTVTKLKDELRSRNLSPSGTKTILIDRLEKADSLDDDVTPKESRGRRPSFKSLSPIAVRSISKSPVRKMEPGSPASEKMTVNQIKQELKVLGLSPVGNKPALLQRLQDAQTSSNPFIEAKREASSVSPSRRKSPKRRPSLSRSPVKVADLKNVNLVSTPLSTLCLFTRYSINLVRETVSSARSRPLAWVNVISSIMLLVALTLLPGPHQATIEPLQDSILWYGKWILLGVLSSVGLGTGAHTFLLFLGPFIARVTTAAYICQSVNFPLHGHNAMLCPPGDYERVTVSILSILNKVKWEAFAWGLGTALGELPPFFIARATALAGKSSGEIHEINQVMSKPRSKRTWLEAAQIASYYVVSKLGFIGILFCASIPNPLFDLAGITCGYFMVPFMVFATATFFGKSIIKPAIQSLFVIFLFSKDNLDQAISYIHAHLPSIGVYLKNWLLQQRRSFQSALVSAKNIPATATYLSFAWNGFLIMMLTYFVISLINSAAKIQAKREANQ